MARLLLVSNRLPVTVSIHDGKLDAAPSAGGLATGLRGPHEASGGLWIGWPGDVDGLAEEARHELDERLAKLRCVAVMLSSDEVEHYYGGFSNAVIWPLFHYMLDRIPPRSQEWEAYRAVNEKFADAVRAVWQPGDRVWVHDYQLLLVPGMLRQRLPKDATIGLFLHIPFPAAEVLRTLPWRKQVLEGMLGADLIGFHTEAFRDHFRSAVEVLVGAGERPGPRSAAASPDRVSASGRQVRLGVFPMGVDADHFSALGADPAVIDAAASMRRACPGQQLLVGVDRLDYTKGIPRRLAAYELLLSRDERFRGKVRLVQVGVPSRDGVASYQDLRREVDEQVGRIAGTYSTLDWAPIRYLHHGLDERAVASLYLAADAMLVTPLRDGMNLVAKEFVASRADEDGVLVLSEFAGAAVEMSESLQVNPYDVQGMAEAFDRALSMPKDERQRRMRALRTQVKDTDVHRWAAGFLTALENASTVPTSP